MQLKLNEEPGLMELNINNINKGLFHNLNKNYQQKKIEETFDNESTNLSFFSTPQLNPLFSFNHLNTWNNNKIKNEISFYENICNDLDYSNIEDKENKKRNKDKNNKIYNDEMLEENIKNVMNKDISEVIKIYINFIFYLSNYILIMKLK